MATKDEDAVTRVFSASTHTPMLFFATGGKAYKLKVWRLPLGTPDLARQGVRQPAAHRAGREHHLDPAAARGRGRAGTSYDVMFATRSGDVRRNKLSRLRRSIRRNGKIAMKLDEGDRIVGVGLCNAQQNDILLTTALGRCHPLRRPTRCGSSTAAIRPACAASAWPRATGHLHGHPAARWTPRRPNGRPMSSTPTPCAARPAARARRSRTIAVPDDEDEAGDEAALSPERIADLGAAEEFILTVSTEGFGKRTSAYEFRRTGRGGQGLLAQDLTKKGKGGTPGRLLPGRGDSTRSCWSPTRAS